jgi:hypothetical protein
MPNHKIPSGITLELAQNVYDLCARPVVERRSMFPLSNDEVQALIMPQEDLDMCLSLGSRQISGIARTSTALLRFNASEVPAGRRPLDRDVLVHVSNINVYYTSYTYSRASVKNRDIVNARANDYTMALLDRIDEASWNKFVTWTASMLRARRRQQLVEVFTDEMLHELKDTTTLSMLWPKLATFTKDERWRTRILETSARSGSYAPSSAKLDCARSYRSAVEEILADASLTNTGSWGTSSKKHADIAAWQFLDGEFHPTVIKSGRN